MADVKMKEMINKRWKIGTFQKIAPHKSSSHFKPYFINEANWELALDGQRFGFHGKVSQLSQPFSEKTKEFKNDRWGLAWEKVCTKGDPKQFLLESKDGFFQFII